MKKLSVYALSLALLLTAAAACSKVGGPGGSAKAVEMVSLMPQGTTGVFVIDVNRLLNTEIAAKALKEGDNAVKYQAAIKKLGLDPQKDVHVLAVGLIGSMGGGEMSGVGILNVTYNKDTLLATMKAEGGKFIEGTYEGVATILVPEGAKEDAEKPAEPAEPAAPAAEPQKAMMGAFLDASNIAIGPEKEVKAVIDVLKKKTPGASANVELMAQVKAVNSKAMVWGVFAFKPEDVKKMVEATPMLSSLASLKGLLLAFDYANKVLEMEIKAVTSDAGKNKEIADMLNGFKAMGSMAAGEKPEVGELLGKIEITSAADNVRIHAAIPEELLNKLGKMAQSEIMNKMGGVKTEEPAPVEEKKAEEIKK